MKKAVMPCLKIFLLTLLLFLCMALSNALINPSQTSSPNGAVGPLLIYSLLNTLILTLWLWSSDLCGVRLAFVCFIVFWGVQYFMTQIETLFFNSTVKMPLPQVFRVVLSGAVYTAAFTLLAVWILGKFGHRSRIPSEAIKKVRFPVLLPRLAAMAFLYVAVYFLFGYFVAWQFSAIRVFYSGSAYLENFFQNMAGQSPTLAAFQLLRGVLWALLATVLSGSLRKLRVWERSLFTGFLFSVLIATPLLFPNAYMPDAVRFGHSFELSSSMMTFGILCGILLKPVFPDTDPSARLQDVPSSGRAV